MAPICAEVYLSRTVFRTFLREFESAETSPGFAQLLGEKLDFQNDVGKKSLNGESLEMNAVISRSFLIKVKCCKFILRK